MELTKEMRSNPAGSRINMPKERISEFRGHRGTCLYCQCIVKMRRASTSPYQLLLDECSCLFCGQTYYVETNLPLLEFEAKQWAEKDGDA